MSDSTPSSPGGSPPATPPPVASVVAAGAQTESDASELTRLRSERDKLASDKKSRELRVMELEAEIQKLKSPPTPAAKTKKSFLDGLAEFFPPAD